jgi:hypothetical protein
MSTTTLSAGVAAFATAVRAALADLPADEVEDLTDGLEADLTERAEDTESLDLGDPVAYAQELRSAAGLAPAARKAPRSESLPESWREVLRDFRQLPKEHAVLRRLGAFFESLRPLWWLFRAWAAYMIIAALDGALSGAPINPFNVFVGIVLLIASVQFGRGKWLPRRWMRNLLTAVNVVVIITVPFAVAWGISLAANPSASYADSSTADLSGTGLMMNGSPVWNVFAYDSNGQPLTGVQLFDQDGHPLSAAADPSQESAHYSTDTSDVCFVPSAAVPGRLAWNVFPLAQPPCTDINAITSEPNQSPFEVPASPEAATVAPLAATSVPTPSPAPTPGPTQTPPATTE